MTKYRPAIKCPTCRSYPNIRFAEEEVRDAGRRPQMQLVQEVTCQSCGTRYWIRAKDIINATPKGTRPAVEWQSRLPERARAALRHAGISELGQLLAIEDWSSIPGIGPSTAKAMRSALEAAGLTRPEVVA